MIFNPEDLGGYTIMVFIGLIYFVFAIPAIIKRFNKKEVAEGVIITVVSLVPLIGLVISLISILSIFLGKRE